MPQLGFPLPHANTHHRSHFHLSTNFQQWLNEAENEVPSEEETAAVSDADSEEVAATEEAGEVREAEAADAEDVRQRRRSGPQ